MVVRRLRGLFRKFPDYSREYSLRTEKRNISDPIGNSANGTSLIATADFLLQNHHRFAGPISSRLYLRFKKKRVQRLFDGRHG